MTRSGRIAATLVSLSFCVAAAHAQVPAGYQADYNAMVDGAKKKGKVVV